MKFQKIIILGKMLLKILIYLEMSLKRLDMFPQRIVKHYGKALGNTELNLCVKRIYFTKNKKKHLPLI